MIYVVDTASETDREVLVRDEGGKCLVEEHLPAGEAGDEALVGLLGELGAPPSDVSVTIRSYRPSLAASLATSGYTAFLVPSQPAAG